MALNDICDDIEDMYRLISVIRFLDLSCCDDNLSSGLIILVSNIEDKLKAVEKFLKNSPTTGT